MRRLLIKFAHQAIPRQHQRRSYFLAPTSQDPQLRADLAYAVQNIRKYDPAGYLPGLLLGRVSDKMQVSYFAVRSFWVETGLRFTNNSYSKETLSPADQVEWWTRGIDEYLYGDNSTSTGKENTYCIHPILRMVTTIKAEGWTKYVTLTTCLKVDEKIWIRSSMRHWTS